MLTDDEIICAIVNAQHGHTVRGTLLAIGRAVEAAVLQRVDPVRAALMAKRDIDALVEAGWLWDGVRLQPPARGVEGQQPVAWLVPMLNDKPRLFTDLDGARAFCSKQNGMVYPQPLIVAPGYPYRTNGVAPSVPAHVWSLVFDYPGEETQAVGVTDRADLIAKLREDVSDAGEPNTIEGIADQLLRDGVWHDEGGCIRLFAHGVDSVDGGKHG